MNLTPEAVNAYRTIMENPAEHGMDFPPIKECFQQSEIATPKHILFNDYAAFINKPIPKIMFYIIMDELYPNQIKAPNGDLGYPLKLNHNPSVEDN